MYEHHLINNQAKLLMCQRLVAGDVYHVYAGAFDTETTGLHIKADKPFLYQCGYCTDEDGTKGHVFIVDLERTPQLARTWIEWWHSFIERGEFRYVGHHVSFDIHMLENIGIVYTDKLWDLTHDTQWYIRASSDALQLSEGGEPLALKDWAVRHINRKANENEKHLKELRTAKAKEYNNLLLKATGWKKGQFNDFFKDKLNDSDDLPSEVRIVYDKWYQALPVYLQKQVTGTVESDMIRYSELPREDVIEYGYLDIEFTLRCYCSCKPVITCRCNWEQVNREHEVHRPFYQMEREGFMVDSDYILRCKYNLKRYIKRRRNDLVCISESPITCNQNARIAQILNDKYNITVESTGAEELELLRNNLAAQYPDAPAVEFIDTILELRTLEKWYSTYIKRFIAQLKLDSKRIYTSIHQVGTVSGRISCDFQQFPKAGLKSIEGEDLFDPRRMVVTSEEFPAIIYLDYSAQELRLQALWTYLIGHPDMNMMRAYGPWKCHLEDGTPYDCESYEHRLHALDWQWLRDEDNTVWEPTDLHGAMTKNIFHIDESDPSFHDLRYVGKRTNFAKNYGASYTRIRQMFPEFDDAKCHEIDEAYYRTFPGVKEYHQACFKWGEELPYVTNLYGVKYYGLNGHKMRNVLVQGSAAYMTKEIICNVTRYMRENNMKSRLVMQIHDEIQFYVHRDDDLHHFFEIQRIMGETDSQVPIFADMEVTVTNWKEKEEVTNEEELRKICNWG